MPRRDEWDVGSRKTWQLNEVKSNALEYSAKLATMCSHIPNRGKQIVNYPGFVLTIGDYSSAGNPHLNHI